MRPVPTLLVGLGLLVAARLGQRGAPPDLGESAVSLGLEHLVQGPEGAAMEWSDLLGKVVVLDFWASW